MKSVSRNHNTESNINSFNDPFGLESSLSIGSNKNSYSYNSSFSALSIKMNKSDYLNSKLSKNNSKRN